jgi:replicative DNA helicase
MQKDLEARLISLIQRNKGILTEAQKFGLFPECFTQYQEQFDFVLKYNHKYSDIPSSEILQANFHECPNIKDVPESELKYLVEELVKSNAARKAIGIINKYQDILITDPYGAIDSIANQLSQIRKTTALHRSLSDKDALKRLAMMKARKEALGKGLNIGIKTGISVLDRTGFGWVAGNLILVVGRPKIGKSWLSQYMACTAYRLGKRVLYISPEMSTDEVELRLDTLLGHMSGYTFLNDRLNLGDVDLVKYQEFLTSLSKHENWITLDSNNGSSFTVNAISALIDEYIPDVVVVDGIVLLEGQGGSDWERVKNLAYGLKSMALNKKVVIIGATQAAKTAGSDMPQADQIAYSDGLLQAADVGIMLQSDSENPDVRYCTLPVMRNHSAINQRLIIKFKVNSGVIEV